MEKKRYQVITVGNAILDAFLSINQPNKFVRVDEEARELCFRYGEKIHVNSASFLLGGNACNVAVGLSRLGQKTALFAEIGDDGFSGKITEALKKETVDMSTVIQTKNAEASFAVGIQFAGERTLFVQHVKREHNFSFEDISSEWAYITSLGDEWKHTYKNVLQWASKNNVKIAFSPGTHQMECFDEREQDREGSQILTEILKNTTILFVNKEEGKRIMNYELRIKNGEDEVKELLRQLQKLGPQIVSVTDGKKGSWVIDENGLISHLDAPQCDVVEKTGAGDSYAAGFLGAVISGKNLKEAMEWGIKEAESVMGRVGAQEGLLNLSQIENSDS